LREVIADLLAASEYAKQLVEQGAHDCYEMLPHCRLRLEELQELLQHILVATSIVQ